MTIGSLLVTLGFKIDGIDDLKDVSKEIDSAVGSATKLALGVDVLTTGLAAMIHGALNATTSLRQFGLVTGLSTEELQQWQYKAALSNVSAQEMADTVENIQKTGMKIATTGEGAQPWVLLGIDPTQNPFKVLAQLQTVLNSMDARRVALARSIVDQTGIGRNVFAMLRQPDAGRLPARFIVNEKDQAKMAALNREWQNLGFLVNQTKTKFISELGPGLTDIVVLLERAASAANRFVQWLDVHPNVAKGLAYAAGIIAGLAASMTVIGGISFALIGAGFAVAFAPIIEAAAAIGAVGGLFEFLKPHLNRPGEYDPKNPLTGKPNLRGQYKNRFGYELGSDSEAPFDPGHPLGRRTTYRDIVPDAYNGGGGKSVTQNNTINLSEAAHGPGAARRIQETWNAQLDSAGFGADAFGY